MHPKLLIVGTVPYDVKESSRAFDAYFRFWEKENIAQIFSNPQEPRKGHCGTLFQITDKNLLKRWLSPMTKVGRVYSYDELQPQGVSNAATEHEKTEKLYKIGRKHTPLIRLLRGVLWRKKFWCTKELKDWMDAFHPECVFLAFSDDYFILRIALYAAKRYQIPIVSCIGDDYYFNKHFSLNPMYQLYKESYKALVRRVFQHPGSAIYISDKIRDKYNSEFDLDGETVYLTSTVQRKVFQPINIEKPLITYFGNIRMGRNQSLCDIADALGKICEDYRLEVYSNEKDDVFYNELKQNPNVIYGGSISYHQVQEKMYASDITVIVEGFKDVDVELSRYSLSTKAADALASGSAILTYGSEECGIVSYMCSTGAAVVCSEKSELKNAIENLIHDVGLQKRLYDRQIAVTEEHHNIQKSTQMSEKVIIKTVLRSRES